MEAIAYKLERPQEENEVRDRRSDSDESAESPSVENACISCMDEAMFPPRQKLPQHISAKLSSVARKLAFITLLCTIVITAFGFFASDETDSMATFGFAFDSFFAVIGSCVLLWRFWSDSPDSYIIAKRETNATAVVAVCLIVSSVAIIVRSVYCLYNTNKPGKPVELVILTSISMFVYSVLFLVKRVVAVKLGSGALMTDAMDSLCGALFALSILISAIVLEFTETAWFLDSSVAIVVSICSFIYGAIVVVKLIRIQIKKETELLEQGYDMLEQDSKLPLKK